MRTLKNSCFGIMLLLIAHSQKAQEPHTNKTIKESVEDIKNLFRKKTIPSGEIEKNAVSAKGHIQGGKIASNAVYIDADFMHNFNQGKAIIQKGNATAMIDHKGNQVIPYNTYRFFALDNTYVFQDHEVYANGFFNYSKNEQEGFINYMNAKGEELRGPQIPNRSTLSFVENLNLLNTSKTLYDKPKNKQGRHPVDFYYIENTGKIYKHSQQLSNIKEGIGIVSGYNNGWKYGYVKLTGEQLTEIQFDEAKPFYNGMAVVGQKDQFGTLKFGCINDKGKLVIPFLFSKQPSNFSAGYAKVKPKDISEFEYAFMNKNGEIVFTQTTEDKQKHGGSVEFEPFQNYGIALTSNGGTYVLDTLFRMKSKAEFFSAYGIAGIAHFKGAYYNKGNGRTAGTGNKLFSVVGETNPKIYYSVNPSAHIGFINLISKTVISPSFSRLGYFDPVSRLAYAEIDEIVQKGGHKVIEITKGYINENGEWVLLQKKEGTW